MNAWPDAAPPVRRRMLVAVEAVPASGAVITAAVQLARRSTEEVLVLSVRERDYTRGFVWDIHQPGEIAEAVSRAVYQLQRAGVPARGLIRTAPAGRVADAILAAARKHDADQIIVGASRSSWLRRFFHGSVTGRVLRLSDRPVLAVPLDQPTRAQRRRGASALEAGPKR